MASLRQAGSSSIPNFQGGNKVPSVSTVGDDIRWKYQQTKRERALGREVLKFHILGLRIPLRLEVSVSALGFSSKMGGPWASEKRGSIWGGVACREPAYLFCPRYPAAQGAVLVHPLNIVAELSGFPLQPFSLGTRFGLSGSLFYLGRSVSLSVVSSRRAAGRPSRPRCRRRRHVVGRIRESECQLRVVVGGVSRECMSSSSSYHRRPNQWVKVPSKTYVVVVVIVRRVLRRVRFRRAGTSSVFATL